MEPSEKTKEQSMSKRVKDRMRGYYYKTKSALQSSDLYVNSKNSRSKIIIDQFLIELRKNLETYKYNEVYFNRKADKNLRLCTDVGMFECGGLWNNSKCAYDGDHTINPYRSREERIIFQTWNFDHKIELSRAIIPNILDAVAAICNKEIICMYCERDIKDGRIETDRYYLQIFTTNNIKLVHIVCHCKSKHDVKSDIYTVCTKCIGIPK